MLSKSRATPDPRSAPTTGNEDLGIGEGINPTEQDLAIRLREGVPRHTALDGLLDGTLRLGWGPPDVPSEGALADSVRQADARF